MLHLNQSLKVYQEFNFRSIVKLYCRMKLKLNKLFEIFLRSRIDQTMKIRISKVSEIPVRYRFYLPFQE